MIDPYPPIRRKQKRRQEPNMQYRKEHYDGADGSEHVDVEG